MKTFPKITFLLIFIFSTSYSFAQQSARQTGIDLYEKGEFEKALESLQEAVKVKKQDQDLWLYIGMAFFKLNKTNKAFEAFNKADSKSIVETAGNEVNIKTISKPKPNYTDTARMYQVQGTVKVAVEVGADGSIKGLVLFKGLPNGLNENSIIAAKKLELEPALKAGKPTLAIKIFEYKFVIY